MTAMADTLITLLSTADIEAAVLTCSALLLARYAPLPVQYQPWLLFNLLAQRVGARVNKAGYSRTQLQLSGLLAIVVILLPVLLLCVLMRQLSDWPAAFAALLLYLSLDAMRFNQHCTALNRLANTGQLQLAREQLQQVVLRDCSQLSAVGVYKASIEVIAQRQARHFAAILCWYLLLGGEAALALRLLLELKQSWNNKQARWQPFADQLAMLTSWLTTPGLWLYGALLALLHRPILCWQYYKLSHDGWLSRTERWLLAAWAAAVACNLAGPVIYDGKKIRRNRLGPSQQPTATQVQLAGRISEHVQSIILLLGLCYTALLLLSYWPHG